MNTQTATTMESPVESRLKLVPLPQASAANNKKAQNLAVAYEAWDKRAKKHVWIVDYFPLVPIKNRKGVENVNKRVKEQWGSGDVGKREAQERAGDLNNIFREIKVAPKLQTWLCREQLDICETVVLHKMKEKGWKNLDDIFEFALKNGYSPPIDAPLVPEAFRRFLLAVRDGEQTDNDGRGGQEKLSDASFRNYRDIYRFVCVHFAAYKPADISVPGCYAIAYSNAVLSYVDSFDDDLSPNGEVVESDRRWKDSMQRGFLRTMSAFLNYCSRHRWRSPIRIPLRKPTKEQIRLSKERLRALRTEEAQAYLDAGWTYKGGFHAAFVINVMFGGGRVGETTRASGDALDVDTLDIDDGIAKNGKGREAKAVDNFIIMMKALEKKNLYNKVNLNCPVLDQMAIRALAGFLLTTRGVRCKVHSAHRRGEFVLDEDGQPYQFGKFPPNAARRTALSMHFQLFRSIKQTVEWGGNSPGIFKRWYVRLCTPEDARLYWAMLPTELIRAGVVAPLPQSHVLDRRLQEETCVAIQMAEATMAGSTTEYQEQQETGKMLADAEQVEKQRLRAAAYRRAHRTEINLRKAERRAAARAAKLAANPPPVLTPEQLATKRKDAERWARRREERNAKRRAAYAVAQASGLCPDECRKATYHSAATLAAAAGTSAVAVASGQPPSPPEEVPALN